MTIRLFLIFILFGPYVGGIVYLIIENYQDMGPCNLDNLILCLTLPIRILAVCVIGYPFSLFFGFLPATLTGICYWKYLNIATNRNPTPLTRAAVGGGIGLLLSISSGLLCNLFLSLNGNAFLFFGIPGTIAGAVCALCITDSIYQLQNNPSSPLNAGT